MLLVMTKTITISLWVSSVNQIQSRKHLLHHQNAKLQFKQTSRSSKLLSPSFNTLYRTRIPATLPLTSTSNHQVTDYDAEIFRFCEIGNLQKVMDLVSKCEDTILDSRTYCHILQLCADLKALHHGKTVHNLICSRGIELDSVLGSKLVFMYVSCGDVREGRRIFDNITNHHVFLWNFMMNAYAKMGDYQEAVSLFKIMQEVGVAPDSYTYSCILKSLAALGNENSGEIVHGYVLKSKVGLDITVVNSMIAFYFKRGNTDNAHKLFDHLPERDVITWNTMISGYVANSLPQKGFSVFSEMLGSHVSVDLTTMVTVLVACSSMGALTLGQTVHAYGVKTTFNKKTKFNNTLLDMYSKCGDMDAALQVFKNMKESEKSVVSWTSLIAGYTRKGQSNKAIELFLHMKTKGVKPDTFTITTILHACASSNSLQKGKEIHNYIKENQIQSLEVSNALMDMYAKCGSMDDSYQVFIETPFKDIVSWNTMIGGYSKNCLPSEALSLFIKIQSESEIKPDNITMTCILPACASLASLNKGREIHAYILRKGLSSDQFIINALIDMYMKCGALLLAKLLFEMTKIKNLVTWTIMVSGYAMHGFGHEALSTFKNMREKGENGKKVIEPNEASFTSILYACSHSGLLNEGQEFYKIMVDEFKIEPKLEHYACMVDILSKKGKLSEAYKFIKKMPIKPTTTIWGALLCGCRFHHDVNLAEKVAQEIFELDPENTENYLLLANIYSEYEKWKEVKVLRDGIIGRGLKKNVGCSWIEIKGKVNIFVGGDKENPEAKKIEDLLDKFKMEMKKDKVKLYGLVDEDMEKEIRVCGHSEMLAMGFGVLKLGFGRTIRVSKNMRVCGECHEMAKFISKNVGREIVLRDSNRFHHFKDGFCSCRGYW
ncbi:hypothetical protein LXL04_010357 [Taraxacum kok-saghyz]